mgnify:CR=1 FL=1
MSGAAPQVPRLPPLPRLHEAVAGDSQAAPRGSASGRFGIAADSLGTTGAPSRHSDMRRWACFYGG